MYEIIAGIIAGLMVKHWIELLVFPCIIGLIETVMLTFRVCKFRFTLTQVAQMENAGMSGDDIQEAREGLNLLNRMVPNGWVIYLWQFVWSSITVFPSCLIVGGMKLLFY